MQSILGWDLGAFSAKIDCTTSPPFQKWHVWFGCAIQCGLIKPKKEHNWTIFRLFWPLWQPGSSVSSWRSLEPLKTTQIQWVTWPGQTSTSMCSIKLVGFGFHTRVSISSTNNICLFIHVDIDRMTSSMQFNGDSQPSTWLARWVWSPAW